MEFKSFVFAAFLVGWSPLSWGGMSAGFAAFASADYPTALKEFLPAAERGDARAQVKLAQMFGAGRGVAYDPSQAEKWFRLAVAQGNPIAQYEVGRSLVNGVEGRNAEGVEMLLASAVQNNINAMEMLGVLYFNGRGVRADSTQALKWFSSAAARGSEFAQSHIALISAKPGVEHGLALFRMGVFSSAMSELKPWAEKGDARAQYAVGAMCEVGDGLSIRQNMELAWKWVELAASQQNAEAQLWLGTHVENPSEKLKLYLLSANQGNADAMFRLGEAYRFGRYGVDKNPDIAMHWYIKAAGTGSERHQFAVGDIYAQGSVVPIDLAQAAKWYREAGDAGFVPALVKLGDIYAQGKGVEKNKAIASEWYRKAIDSDSVDAQRGLAELVGE